MLAKLIGGPHDGLKLDHSTINRCCIIQSVAMPTGIVTFILTPATEDWVKVLRGEIHKDDLKGPLFPYFQIHTETGVEFHFDHDGHKLAEVIATPLPEEDNPEPEGNYYKCLHGDSENLGLTEPDSFVVEDAKGRNWICYPVSEEDVENLNLLDHVADAMAADAALSRHGLSQQGTEVRVYFCQDEAELKDKLGHS